VYIYDLYFPKYKLVCEIDGSNHYYKIDAGVLAKTKMKYENFDKAKINYFKLEHMTYKIDKEIQEDLIINRVKEEIEISKLIVD
jgi:very-short-patch-repair endonuclease